MIDVVSLMEAGYTIGVRLNQLGIVDNYYYQPAG